MVAITFKVSPEEARAIRAAARASHKNVSAFIRSKVIEAPATRPRRRIIKKHPVSGLPYDATDEGGRIVTLQEIKVALADMKEHAGGFISTAPSPNLDSWATKPAQTSDTYLSQIAAADGLGQFKGVMA